MAVESALLDPVGLQKRRLCARGRDQNVGIAHGRLHIAVAGDELHIREITRKLPDKHGLLLRVFGGQLADLQARTRCFHAEQMQLGLLAGSDEADHLGILPRELPCRDCAHRRHAHIGAERPVHHADRIAVFKTRQHNDGRKVLRAEFARVLRENRHPLHAADAFLQKRRREAVDAVLRLLIEDLDDLIGEKNFSFFKIKQPLFQCCNAHLQVKCACVDQFLLRKREITDRVLLFHIDSLLILGNTAQLRLRASTDLFRQSCGLKSLKYCAAVGDEGALRMRHAPCGYIQDSCTFQTLT